MNTVPQRVKVEEVTMTLEPAPGVSIEQMLSEANIRNPQKIEVFVDRVLVTVFKRSDK